MPFVLALLASALIHVAALIGPGWDLPGLDDGDAPTSIDAVLVRPAPRRVAAPAPKPTQRPAAEKRRLPPVHTAPVTPATPELEPDGGGADANGAAGSGVAAKAPAAVPPAPTIVPPPPPRIDLPEKGRVRYVITRGEGGLVVGQSVHTWEHDGTTYQMQSVTETTGLAALFKSVRVVLNSSGAITAAGLEPHQFRHERVKGVDTASFDWARGVVAYAGREEDVGVGAQDMLSMYYQLVLLKPQSGTFDLAIATGRKVETYHLETIGEESLALPAGARSALHLKTRSGNDTLDVWLAADMRALPLKIRYTDRKGEIFDQLATDIDIQEKQ
jgi:hypothetical protein